MTDKYLKIMADYSSTGLWDRFGMEIMFEEVPELPFWWVPKFKEWTEWYEENDDWMEESEHDFPYQAFSDAGRELTQKLANVFSDWEIWYFDEAEMLRVIQSEKNSGLVKPKDENEQKYLIRIVSQPSESQGNT